MENNEFKNWCNNPKGGKISEDTANIYWKYLSKELIFNDGHITKIVDYDELVRALGCKKVSPKDDEIFKKIKKARNGISKGDACSAINKYIEFLKHFKNERVEGMGNSTDKTKYCGIVKQSKNVILRGAPGTGKTYLAKQIAANLISDGRTDKIEELTENEQNQVGFVQFHPSYDYTDFVEGLRPRHLENNLGFELESGIFKSFCERAKEKIYEIGDKSIEDIWCEVIESIGDETNNIEYNVKAETKNLEFKANSRGNITYTVPGGTTASLTLEQVKYYLENRKWSEKNYHQIYKRAIFKKYIEPIINDITLIKNEKPYVFIIDEINRGEISKIFGELFFSIDPGYRGEKGGILTQYANLHENPNEKFYIPENVYIIGTMNDIDRSVDTFDFAMRRRFRFIEIKADDNIEMLEGIDSEAKYRMKNLNKAISEIEGLNANYHIGPSYFLKLSDLESNYAELWTDYLLPLLQDYVRGMYDEKGILEKFEAAYKLKSNERTENENDEN